MTPRQLAKEKAALEHAIKGHHDAAAELRSIAEGIEGGHLEHEDLTPETARAMAETNDAAANELQAKHAALG